MWYKYYCGIIIVINVTINFANTIFGRILIRALKILRTELQTTFFFWNLGLYFIYGKSLNSAKDIICKIQTYIDSESFIWNIENWKSLRLLRALLILWAKLGAHAYLGRHTFFGHNSAIFGPIWLIFVEAQDTVIYHTCFLIFCSLSGPP